MEDFKELLKAEMRKYNAKKKNGLEREPIRLMTARELLENEERLKARYSTVEETH